MRFLIVGAIQGGTVPLTRAVHRGFREAGAETDILDFSDSLSEFLEARTSGSPDRETRFMLGIRLRLLEKISAFKPEAILALAQSPLNDPEMLSAFRKAGIRLCYWFMEDYRIFGYWAKIAPLFDFFFTIQKDPLFDELRRIGCSRVHYLPMAYDTAWGNEDWQQSDPIRVSFVGAPYPNRVHFFKSWEGTGFEIYGDGWEKHSNPNVIMGNRRISESEARSIYRRSIVNLNLHSSALPFEFTGGDFVNPRTFELAGLGAFQLLNMRTLLTLHFDPVEEIIALNSWKDMKKAAAYFLKQDSERSAIAAAARRRVLKEHTYRQRAEEIMSLLN